MKKLMIALLVVLVALVGTGAAEAATGAPIVTGGQTCWVSGKVKMRFFVAANSTPVTGYYITGGASNDPSATTPTNAYQNTFVSVSVPAGNWIVINTTFKKWFSTTGPLFGNLTSTVKFTSGAPSIPAPTVFKGSPFFVCG